MFFSIIPRKPKGSGFYLKLYEPPGSIGLHIRTDAIWGFPKIRGTLLGGPHNKDYSILGSILGSRNFGKLPYGSRTLRSFWSEVAIRA